MKIIHYNLSSNFELLLDLGSSYSGEDFAITFTSGKNKACKYVCSRVGSTYTNCSLAADERHVLCYFDHYNLGCGMLFANIVVYYEDDAMPSGSYPIGDTEMVEALDSNSVPYHIELTQGQGDTPTTSEMVWNLVGTIMRGEQGDQGERGTDGVSIVSLSQTVASAEDNGINVWRATLSNGLTFDLQVRNGSKGATGTFSETEKTLFTAQLKTVFSQLNHKHTILDISDLDLTKYIKYPETAGTAGQVLSLDDEGNPIWKDVQGGGSGGGITKEEADGWYVAKEDDKGLSENDYTDADKTKLEGVEAGAQVNPTDYVKEADIADMETKTNAAATYQPKGDYAPASHTHTKDEITDFPDIPSTASEITTTAGISEGKNVQSDLAQLAAQVSSKYEKPSDGIPSTDLASAVQTSISRADEIYDDYIATQNIM